jgi:uncharacterized membrane protein YccC
MSAIPATSPAHQPYHPHNPWYFFTTSGDLGYAIRTTLAGVMSLIIVMWIQLDVPRWTILTTLIVSPPVRGNALRKSVARLAGTVIGCVVGVILIALFPQDRIGFFLSCSLWLGFCAYWGTLRRGFVAYTAILCGFTSALVALGAIDSPDNVFYIAIDRGSATFIGCLVALVMSEAAVRSDDAPGELANRGSKIIVSLFDWAVAQLGMRPPATLEKAPLEDAPFSSLILSFDELNRNAMAERPSLRWVSSWILGCPTALLSIQSNVIAAVRRRRQDEPDDPQLDRVRDGIMSVRNLIVAGAELSLEKLRQQAESLARLRQDLPARSLYYEIISAVQYVLVVYDAILTQRQPHYAQVQRYPEPRFVGMHMRAWTNFNRAAIGLLIGFLIWDATAWSQGSFFLTVLSVALVIYISIENPLALNSMNVLSASIGVFVALAGLYLVMPWSDHPLWFSVVTYALLFPAVWLQAKPKFLVPAITFMFVVSTLLDPTNPQQYDLKSTLNSAVAIISGYAIIRPLFFLIGTPKAGRERMEELLQRMRKHIRDHLKERPMNRDERLRWETGMYDVFQRFQAEAMPPEIRAKGVELLMRGRQIMAGAEQ